MKCRYFSPSVAPILLHPALEKLNHLQLVSIEVQLLYRYLRFTEYLETQLVNKVILDISNDHYQLHFSKAIKEEAYKIYCDEAFHTLQAADMTEQIRNISEIEPLPLRIELEDRITELKLDFREELVPYFDLFFVAVAENLVSQELNGCVKDKSMHPQIANLMRDHAKDEVSHAIFFKAVMKDLYQNLGVKLFEELASKIPAFLKAYLIPSRENLELIFQPHLSIAGCNELMNDWYEEKNIDNFIRNSSVNLIKTVMSIQK